MRRRYLAEQGHFIGKNRQMNIEEFIQKIDNIIYLKKGTRIPLDFPKQITGENRAEKQTQESSSMHKRTKKGKVLFELLNSDDETGESSNEEKSNTEEGIATERKPYQFRLIVPPPNGRTIEAVYKEMEEEQKMMVKIQEMNEFRRRSAYTEITKKKNGRALTKRRWGNQLAARDDRQEEGDGGTSSKGSDGGERIETGMNRLFLTEDYAEERNEEDAQFNKPHMGNTSNEIDGGGLCYNLSDQLNDSQALQANTGLTTHRKPSEVKATCKEVQINIDCKDVRINIKGKDVPEEGPPDKAKTRSLRPVSSPLMPAQTTRTAKKEDTNGEEAVARNQLKYTPLPGRLSAVLKHRSSSRTTKDSQVEWVEADASKQPTVVNRSNNERLTHPRRPKSSLDGYSLARQRRIRSAEAMRRASFSEKNSQKTLRKLSMPKEAEIQLRHEARRPKTAVSKGYATVQMTIGRQSVSVYVAKFKKETMNPEQIAGRANAKLSFEKEQARIKRSRLTIANAAE